MNKHIYNNKFLSNSTTNSSKSCFVCLFVCFQELGNRETQRDSNSSSNISEFEFQQLHQYPQLPKDVYGVQN